MTTDTSVVVKLNEGFQTHITSGDHSWTADEPEEAGGTDTGPTPYQLLLSAIGSCKAMTLKMYAARKNFPMTAVTLELSHGRAYAEDCENCEEDDRKISIINVKVKFTGDLTGEEKIRLIHISERCPVHKTVSVGIKIVTTLED